MLTMRISRKGGRRRLTSLAAALALACAGCSGGRVTIEGAATYDGQPIETGSIVFEPAEGTGASAGGTIEGGRYTAYSEAGVSPGKKIVRITAVRKTGRQVEAGPPHPAGTTVDEIERYIPANYNTESTLTCEITEGNNEHDFHLQSGASGE